MPNLTSIYRFKKPLKTEKYNLDDQNGNMDLIEQVIKRNDDALSSHLADDASLTQKGHVQLNSATDSMDETTAATPKAVSDAYNKTLVKQVLAGNTYILYKPGNQGNNRPTVYTKLLSYKLTGINGQLRISFDLTNGSDSTVTAYAMVGKSGTLIGLETTNTATTAVTRTQDLDGFVYGDTVEIWTKVSKSTTYNLAISNVTIGINTVV